MKPVATAMTLILWCASCGKADEPLPAPQLVEATTLFTQGQRLREAGRYAEAVTLAERALALREPVLGTMHPDVASCLSLLGDLHRRQGRYMSAEPLLERALAIRQAALGNNDLQVAASLQNLANLYLNQGLDAWAEPLYARALAIRQASLGGTHPWVADSLNSLGTLYKAQGLFAQAEHLYIRALTLREMTLGKDHPDVGASLNDLANLYLKQGLHARAEPLFIRALNIRKAALGNGHPDVACSLHNLAVLYMEQGFYARAEPLYVRALDIWAATLGDHHPHVAQTLSNLARLRLAQQRLAEALPLLARALSATETLLRQETFGFSETRLTRLLRLLRDDEDLLYALVREHPDDARVRHLALSAALLRKGRSLKELANTSRLLLHGLEQPDQTALDRLRALRTQIAALSFLTPGSRLPSGHQQRLTELITEATALEADLSRKAAPLRERFPLPPPNEVIDQVAQALPKDGALLEFVTYRDSLRVPPPVIPASQTAPSLRYLVLVLSADGLTQAFDLGDAETINRAAMRLHDALARRAVTYRPAAQALYKLAFLPLRLHLKQVKRLFISLDGQLAQIPFSSLHDGRHFLLDEMDITYLGSGTDLLPRHVSPVPARSMVVVANPNFNTSSPSDSEPLEDVPWTSLPGSKKEAEALHALLPQARFLLGPAATKKALLTLDTPGVLHIATHGFLLGESSPLEETRAVQSFGVLGDTGNQELQDPLLRSGLVLSAGHASTPQPSPPRREESLLTALELASLDLWGTQLVVLSACNSGRGHIEPGQGVYGLRSALAVAGAESLVTSLWRVSDETTRELMKGYYRNLLKGQGRAAALNRAMRDLRRQHPHPYFWAPFIHIGKDEPLQGLFPSNLTRPVP